VEACSTSDFVVLRARYSVTIAAATGSNGSGATSEKSYGKAPEVRPATMEAPWVDQHQQLSRTLVTNAFIERQLALRRDTEKLLSLAAELKQNVDKTSPSVLSMDVIKKAQEIEKLAKSVKDKMKDAY